MFINLATVLALVATVVASPAPSLTTRAQSLNPPLSVLQGRPAPSVELVDRSLTNAKRIALGLPLLPPKPRRAAWQLEAARALPSGTPILLTTGYIRILDATTGTDLGLVSKTWNEFGEYVGLGSSDTAEALRVKIDLVTASLGAADIVAANTPNPNFPFVGAITGFASDSDNIGPESANYLYIGGTKQTPPHSPPATAGNAFTAATGIAERSESAIFKYDALTSLISAQYVNTDASTPVTYIGLTQNILLLAGDKAAFADVFGPTTWVTLKFVLL